jgi:hypothetical protein
VLVQLAQLATLPAVDTRLRLSICSFNASTFRRYAPPPPPPAPDLGVAVTEGPPPPSLHGAILFQKWILLGALLRGDERPCWRSDASCTWCSWAWSWAWRGLGGRPYLPAAEYAEAALSGLLNVSAAAALKRRACLIPWSARASTSSRFNCCCCRGTGCGGCFCCRGTLCALAIVEPVVHLDPAPPGITRFLVLGGRAGGGMSETG